MRFLVTGGAGFIGSHLSRHLLDDGHAVDVLDDLSTGTLANLADLHNRPSFAFHKGSATDIARVAELSSGCDGIYHLASIVGVQRVLQSPLRALKDTHDMTDCVLGVAATLGRRVVITSSSEVYGKNDALPLAEDHDLVLGAPTKGRWSYAAAKMAGEHLAIALHREAGLQVATARLFNTTGPGQVSQYGMVLPTFVDQALGGVPITIFGDGSQSRCFTHVSDVVRALRSMMDQDGCVGGIFNIGSSQPTTILGLAQRVRAACGSASPIVHVDPGILGREFEEIVARQPDTRRIRAALGWEPVMDLDAIIADMIAARTHQRVAE